jgi:hypothetical protein
LVGGGKNLEVTAAEVSPRARGAGLERTFGIGKRLIQQQRRRAWARGAKAKAGGENRAHGGQQRPQAWHECAGKKLVPGGRRLLSHRTWIRGRGADCCAVTAPLLGVALLRSGAPCRALQCRRLGLGSVRNMSRRPSLELQFKTLPEQRVSKVQSSPETT